MRQLTRKAEVGVLRACEDAALRRSIFDMFQHMKRGCTRWSWTCFLSESDRSGITVFVGHKGEDDKGSWHVHGCVNVKSMITMTAKIDHVQLYFFRSCSEYRLQLQSQRRKGLDCRSQSPSRQRHGITLAATLSHFPFSFFLELIATLFSRVFFLFCDTDKSLSGVIFLHKKEGLILTGLGIGYIYTWCGRAETLAIWELSCENCLFPCTASVTFLDHQTGVLVVVCSFAETRVKSTVVNEKQSPSFKSRAGGVGNIEHHDFQFLCSNTSWIRVRVRFSAMRKSRGSTLSAFLLPCALTSTSELMSHRESEAFGHGVVRHRNCRLISCRAQ